MAFHFELEAILRLRRGQERSERLKLEAIASEQAQVRRRLEHLAAEFLSTRREFQEQMSSPKFAAELQFENERRELVQAARAVLELRLSKLEELRLRQLAAFTIARQGREMMESLRRRQLERYRQYLSRREQQELDDLFLMRRDFPGDE